VGVTLVATLDGSKIRMNKIDNPTKGGDWSVQWIPGELCDVNTGPKLLDHLAKLNRNADTAKIFQGTEGGKPVIYIVTRWR
jgi:hypothetical protein